MADPARADLIHITYDANGSGQGSDVIEAGAEIVDMRDWFDDYLASVDDDRLWIVEADRAYLLDDNQTTREEIRYDLAAREFAATLVTYAQDRLIESREAVTVAEGKLQAAVQDALEAGVSAVDLAARLGVSRARVYQIRDGRR